MCVWCAKEIAVVSKVFRHYDVCPRRRTQRQEKTRSFQTLNEREKSVRKKLRALVKNELNTANHQTSSTSNANKEDSLETTRSSDCVRGKRRHFPEALSAPPLSKRRLVINEGNAAQAYPSHQSHFGDATDALNNAEASGVWSAAFQNPESSLVAGNNAFQPVESVNQNDVNNPDAILPQVNFNSGNPFSAASDTVTADQYMMDMLSSTNALPRAPTLKVHTMDGPPLFLAAHYYEDIHNGSAPQQNPTEYFQATGGHK
ncbi:hypothetical protein LX36DRAFT_295773 [Colletotrichum falcatum]|nr:hypothetical protein LX36DRAFT_295773 [Colletotrichum falcatum]